MTNSPPTNAAERTLEALPGVIRAVALDGTITWPAALRGQHIMAQTADASERERIAHALSTVATGNVPLVQWEVQGAATSAGRVLLTQVTPLPPEADADADADSPVAADRVVAGFVFATMDISATHRSREALIRTGIALAEAIAVDQVYEEVATQLQRAIPSAGIVIALADDETAEFRIAHQRGFEEAVDLSTTAMPLVRHWLDALARNEVIAEPIAGYLLLTAPLISPEGVLGALTVRALPVDERYQWQLLHETRHLLSVIGAQTAVAIERAWLVERVEGKRRLEAIGEVAAGVAHELRNPLFSISSAAQLIRLRTASDEAMQRNVGRILTEVHRLNRMVSELLEFGKPNTTHLILWDPDAVWDEILDAERQRIEERSLTLERARAPKVHAQIDAAQLAQVFRNVLVNAVDASPPNQTLRLTSMLTTAGAWRCRLTNGGPVIPPDVLPHVFEFFYSTKDGGTGIGLALCQRIMDEHGGTITMESTVELGTTVQIGLPVAIMAPV